MFGGVVCPQGEGSGWRNVGESGEGDSEHEKLELRGERK